MKCTDSNRCARVNRRRKKRRRQRMIRRIVLLMTFMLVVVVAVTLLKFVFIKENKVAKYEAEKYNTTVFKGDLYSANLCVASENIAMEGEPSSEKMTGAAVFDVDDAKTLYATNIHEKLYPASLTKLMTALVALKKSNLDDVVTVSENADCSKFAYDEKTCGIKMGDKITLRDLLYGLILYSGNDNAVAIAEAVGGSVDEFANMMNEEATKIMATNSHFVNPNGLHDENHYTTTYDLYLIFNQCLKYDEFNKVLASKSYTANVTDANNVTREIIWEPTNLYATGEVKNPTTTTVIGGKTGTTKKAGNCLILLDQSQSGKKYISVIMGAETRELLYQNMTTLLKDIEVNK